ncbi:MAG: hypothetical protein VX475_14815 [Myxococcota bacterium]|nr:hypothetical protein [Myxococcota bacterium]
MKKLLDRIGKTLLTLTTLMLIPSLGWSEGSGHEGHGRDARVGVLFIGGGTREHAHTIPTYGVVMLGEVVLIPDWLEVELSSAYTRHSIGHELTEMFVLKKPWHAGKHMEVFLGAGAMVRQRALHSELLRERAVQTHVWTTGPMVQVGSIYWLAPRWGLTAEVEYIQDLHDHVHEVEGLAGLLYRFGAPTHLAKH